MNLRALKGAEVIAIILTVLGIFAGFIAGRQQTTDEIEAIKTMQAAQTKRLDAIEAMQQRRTGALYCAIRTLDKMTEKLGVAPPCEYKDMD